MYVCMSGFRKFFVFKFSEETYWVLHRASNVPFSENIQAWIFADDRTCFKININHGMLPGILFVHTTEGYVTFYML